MNEIGPVQIFFTIAVLLGMVAIATQRIISAIKYKKSGGKLKVARRDNTKDSK